MFLYRFNIVITKQSGCLKRSVAQTTYTEKQVSYHLSRLKVLFVDGILNENHKENMDKTHSAFNKDSYDTLGMRGVDSANYADVVVEADGFTILLRLIGGTNARLEAPFIIFKNRDSNYPVKNFPDNIDGASNLNQLRRCIDNNVFHL